MQRQGLESTYLSKCNKLNKVLKLWHDTTPLLLYRCGYSQLILNQMKFRLVQIGRLKKTNGWNLMFGKTFVRSFHWTDKEKALFFLDKMNETLKDIDNSCCYSKKLIKKGEWIKPPNDCYIP